MVKRLQLVAISPADEVMGTLLAGLRRLGWQVLESGPRRLRARTQATFWSWGESIVVAINDLPGDRSNVYIESDPISQVFDWGKSDENLAKVRELLREHLSG